MAHATHERRDVGGEQAEGVVHGSPTSTTVTWAGRRVRIVVSGAVDAATDERVIALAADAELAGARSITVHVDGACCRVSAGRLRLEVGRTRAGASFVWWRVLELLGLIEEPTMEWAGQHDLSA